MVIVVVLLALAFLSVLAIILLRRAGGGRFPWLQFYMKGRESGFIFHEINLLRRVAVESKLENPTALFWSMKQLDRAIKGTIITYRARSQEQDPEYNLLLSKLFELRKRVEFDQPKYKIGHQDLPQAHAQAVPAHHAPGLGPFASDGRGEPDPLHGSFPSRWARSCRTVSPGRTRRSACTSGGRRTPAISSRPRSWRTSSTRKYPILHIAHSDNLIRTQKRNSVRVEADIPAELFPLKSIDEASEIPEGARGLRCRLADLSEGGAADPHRRQGPRGTAHQGPVQHRGQRMVMSGVVKGITFDQKKNRSLLHMQATASSVAMRNRILMYVYNLFGERETIVAGKKPDRLHGSGLGRNSAEGDTTRAETGAPAPRGPDRAPGAAVRGCH